MDGQHVRQSSLQLVIQILKYWQNSRHNSRVNAMKEFRGRFLRGIFREKSRISSLLFRFAKNVKEISGPHFKILPDYYYIVCQRLNAKI